MRHTHGRISQMGGALLAIGLVLALGAISLKEQRAQTPGSTGAGQSGLNVGLPRQLIGLGQEEPTPYTIAYQRDESLPTRGRLYAHVVVPGASRAEMRRAGERAAARLLAGKQGTQAVLVLLFASEESQRRGERLALGRLLYAPDGCGWEGAPVGQPVVQYARF